VFDSLSELISYLDEPIGDNSILPTYIISKHASKSGVKVVLTGAGGDEIFGGYRRYLPNRALAALHSLPLFMQKIICEIVKIADRDKAVRLQSKQLNFVLSMSGSSPGLLELLLGQQERAPSIISNMVKFAGRHTLEGFDGVSNYMHLDLRTFLVDDILALTDKMTMACSLEARVPYLDHRLVELLFRIPSETKLKNGNPKSLQRRIFRDLLPHDILELPKMGFAGPTSVWVDHLWDTICEELLIKQNDFYREFIGFEFLQRELGLKRNSLTRSEKTSIWHLYLFDQWYKKHIQRTT
jgi:asparagine synthase (glutamine-hydrolysing)